MSWIDTTIVWIIVAGGMAILYKALKEPLDHLFGFIWAGLGKLKDVIVGAKDSGGEYFGEIHYG